MEQAVLEAINKESHPFDGELLQNEEPKHFNDACQTPLIMLRWRIRQCHYCSSSFDITQEGRFYRCGGCIP